MCLFIIVEKKTWMPSKVIQIRNLFRIIFVVVLILLVKVPFYAIFGESLLKIINNCLIVTDDEKINL